MRVYVCKVGEQGGNMGEKKMVHIADAACLHALGSRYVLGWGGVFNYTAGMLMISVEAPGNTKPECATISGFVDWQ